MLQTTMNMNNSLGFAAERSLMVREDFNKRVDIEVTNKHGQAYERKRPR